MKVPVTHYKDLKLPIRLNCPEKIVVLALQEAQEVQEAQEECMISINIQKNFLKTGPVFKKSRQIGMMTILKLSEAN